MPACPPLIARCYEAWNARNLDALCACLHPDIEFHVPGAIPFAGEIRGTDAVGRYVEQVWRFWPEQFIEVDRVVAKGELVVVHGAHAGLDEDGVLRRMPFVHAMELADGRVVRLREQLDAGHVMRAVLHQLRRADADVGALAAR